MKLASIEKIFNIKPIEGSDFLATANVLGWQVVVRKDDFVEDGFCVFIPIDTVVPNKPWTEFMKNKDFRVRTIRLRKQWSQGLALPVSILTDEEYLAKMFGDKDILIMGDKIMLSDKSIGKDLTDVLGIIKYEKPIPETLRGKVKGRRPGFVPKTDEVLLQSEPWLLRELIGKPYYITMKIDGQSASYYKKENTFGVCSRNLEVEETEGSYWWKIANDYNMAQNIPLETTREIVLQGELAGPGIQKNPLKLEAKDWFCFDIFDIHENEYWDYDVVDKFCYAIGLKRVSLVDIGNSFNMTMEQLQELANKIEYSPGIPAEGIVVRSQKETMVGSHNQRLSFKVINQKYALREE